jgi:hypothetical protein
MNVPTLGFHFHAMKTYFSSLLGVTALSCVIATGASCSDRHRSPDPTLKSVEITPSPNTNPTPERTLPPSPIAIAPVAAAIDASLNSSAFDEASAIIDRVTRASVADLNSVPENLSKAIDANISTWKARGGVSTNTGESKLELARTDFAQKVRTLTLADDETWKTAKSAAHASLEDLRRAYEALIAVPDRA